MNNQTTSELGTNRTGAKMSPKNSVKAAEGAVQFTPTSPGDSSTLGKNRASYMVNGDAVGTVPLPGSLKGVFSALQEKLMQGDHTFVDKLGERIAFERTGTRLFEALISKYQGSEDSEDYPDIGIIEMFKKEEQEHFLMVSHAMEEIGGDPTAMTPSADVAGVAASGWVQAISDPRTSFKQSLEIILQAELVDNDCWGVLIELATNVGLHRFAEKFQKAKDEEDIHLETIRGWVLEMNINGGKLISPQIH